MEHLSGVALGRGKVIANRACLGFLSLPEVHVLGVRRANS